MAETDTTNSAQRLYVFLQGLRHAAENQTDRFDKVICRLWEIDGDDHRTVLLTFMDLLRLAELALEDGYRLADEITRSKYMEPVEPIHKKLFNNNPYMQIQHFWFDADMMAKLDYAAHFLTINGVTETVVDQEQLDSLRQQADSLLEQLLAAELPDQLRTYLISTIEKFRYAIITYSLNGVAGLEIARLESAGALYQADAFLNVDSATHNDGQSLMKQVMEYVRTVSSIINLVQQSQKLLTHAPDAIGNMLDQIK